jgi:hypothetical protein
LRPVARRPDRRPPAARSACRHAACARAGLKVGARSQARGASVLRSRTSVSRRSLAACSRARRVVRPASSAAPASSGFADRLTTSSRRVRCLGSAPRTGPRRLRQVHRHSQEEATMLTLSGNGRSPTRSSRGTRTAAPQSPRSPSPAGAAAATRPVMRRTLGGAGGACRRAPDQRARRSRSRGGWSRGRGRVARACCVALEVHGVEYGAEPRGDAGAERSDEIASQPDRAGRLRRPAPERMASRLPFVRGRVRGARRRC